METTILFMVLWGLYRGNGKEHGNYLEGQRDLVGRWMAKLDQALGYTGGQQGIRESNPYTIPIEDLPFYPGLSPQL